MNTRLRDVQLFLFDMDGTLYIGNHLFDFTEKLLRTIRDTGKKYLFITNNSSKSVEDYIKKLEILGIPAEYNDFLTSSQATAYYLTQNYPNHCLYVCGTQSLKRELVSKGFEITEDDTKAECVVVGFDTELTFRKIEDVCKILLARDVPYIATNPDYVCPTEYGSVPDCGSLCDMLFQATGKRPYVIGKPSKLMIELAMKKEGVSRERTAVIGDRIYTDIKSGLNAGTVTVLVLSGETTPEVAKASPDHAEYIMDSAEELLAFLGDSY